MMTMKYKYTYIGEEPRDFPTIGYRNVENGQTVESDEQLFSPFLIDNSTPKPTVKDDKTS